MTDFGPEMVLNLLEYAIGSDEGNKIKSWSEIAENFRLTSAFPRSGWRAIAKDISIFAICSPMATRCSVNLLRTLLAEALAKIRIQLIDVS